MIVVLVCGFLLTALVLAMIFSRTFLESLLDTNSEAEATFGNKLTIRGQLVLALCLAFIAGMSFPLWIQRNDIEVGALEDEVAALEITREELDTRISDLEREQYSSNQMINSLQESNDQLSAEKNSLQERLETSMSSANSQSEELTTLRDELDSVRRLLDRQNERIEGITVESYHFGEHNKGVLAGKHFRCNQRSGDSNPVNVSREVCGGTRIIVGAKRVLTHRDDDCGYAYNQTACIDAN